MQQITVEAVKGPLGKGEKKFYAVKAEGIKKEFTSFDTRLAALKPGTVLEIEPVMEGDYVNIKSGWKVISEPASSEQAAAKGVASPEEIDSRYRIAALECAVRMAAAGKVSDINGIFIHADQFYCWLTGKPLPKVNVSAPTPPVNKVEVTKPGDAKQSFVPTESDKDFDKLGRSESENPAKPVKDIDARAVYDLVMANVKLNSDKGVESWLSGVMKLEMERLETEPDKAFKEVEEHFKNKGGK